MVSVRFFPHGHLSIVFRTEKYADTNARERTITPSTACAYHVATVRFVASRKRTTASIRVRRIAHNDITCTFIRLFSILISVGSSPVGRACLNLELVVFVARASSRLGKITTRQKSEKKKKSTFRPTRERRDDKITNVDAGETFFSPVAVFSSRFNGLCSDTQLSLVLRVTD